MEAGRRGGGANKQTLLVATSGKVLRDIWPVGFVVFCLCIGRWGWVSVSWSRSPWTFQISRTRPGGCRHTNGGQIHQVAAMTTDLTRHFRETLSPETRSFVKKVCQVFSSCLNLELDCGLWCERIVSSFSAITVSINKWRGLLLLLCKFTFG